MCSYGVHYCAGPEAPWPCGKCEVDAEALNQPPFMPLMEIRKRFYDTVRKENDDGERIGSGPP